MQVEIKTRSLHLNEKWSEPSIRARGGCVRNRVRIFIGHKNVHLSYYIFSRSDPNASPYTSTICGELIESQVG